MPPEEEVSSMDILARIGVEPEVEEVDDEVIDNPVVDPDPDTADTPEEVVVDTPDPEDTAQPEPLILGKFKSVEDMERSYTELERRLHDEAERRAEHERYIQLLDQQQQAAAFDDVAPKNKTELMELSYEEPEKAFWFAAEKAPNQVGNVLAEIRSWDPHRAEQLLIEYNQEMLNHQMQQVQKPNQDREIRDQAQSLAQQLHSSVASMPHYEVVKNDMMQLLADPQRQKLITMDNPAASQRVLHDVYELAVFRNQQKVAAADNARRRQHDNAAGTPSGVETGGNIETPSINDDVNPMDAMRDAITKAANGSSW